MPVVRSRLFASATVTRLLVPLKLSAPPNLPAATCVAPVIVPGLFCPEESAAVGPGEIDLATAGDGRWNPDVVDKCDAEYARARWPDGPPHDFSHRLAVARLYTQLRWLGDRSEWTPGSKVSWRFRYAERAARELGLL